MVLRLKAWESRSPPGLPSRGRPRRSKRPPDAKRPVHNVVPRRRKADCRIVVASPANNDNRCRKNHDAGWSSPVARQAHNLKVVGSNPTPATKLARNRNRLRVFLILGNMPMWSTGITMESRRKEIPRKSGGAKRLCLLQCSVFIYKQCVTKYHH